jgi:tight adherence protein B
MTTGSFAGAFTGLFAGCLTAVVLSMIRVRADHRLRDAPIDARSSIRAPRWPVPRARRRPGPAEIAGWCDALAREVRSGGSLGAALRTVPPPDGTRLAAIGHALGRGRPLADALEVPVASGDEAAVLTVLASCAHHGGPAARPLDQVAATLRRRAADAAERAVHSSQARLSALVMTALPGGVLVLLLATSTSVRSVSATPVGLVTVVVGVGLNLLGWLWMRRIIPRRPG